MVLSLGMCPNTRLNTRVPDQTSRHTTSSVGFITSSTQSVHSNVDLVLSAFDRDFSRLRKGDATNTLGCVRFSCSADIEAVLLSALETVLGPNTAVPDSSLQALLRSATFSDDRPVPPADQQKELVQPDSVQACMNFEDFQKWCHQLPSMKKFLLNLLTPPSPGKCVTLLVLLRIMEK